MNNDSYHVEKCSRCKGTGRIKEQWEMVWHGQEYSTFEKKVKCKKCNGLGVIRIPFKDIVVCGK